MGLNILLVNDDGPIDPTSPHVFPLYQTLLARGHAVTVCLPSSQKSWGSMAFTVKGEIAVWWYYPKNDGRGGRWVADEKERGVREGEAGEWVLVDGSPTTATSIGLNSSYLFNDHPSSSSPPKSFDLVISGPNFGRNTSRAFCLGSGTVGAAMAGAMSGCKSIAISYGHFAKIPAGIKRTLQEIDSRAASNQSGSSKEGDPAQVSALNKEEANNTNQQGSTTTVTPEKDVVPSAPKELCQLAHDLSVDIIERLYREWEEEVDVYTINVPLCWTLRQPQIYHTRMWVNSYPRLFAPVAASSSSSSSKKSTHLPPSAPEPQTKLSFQPEMAGMMAPEDLEPGTDVWAIMNGHVSINRLQTSYQEVKGAPSAGRSGSSGKAGDVETTTQDLEKLRFAL